MYIIKQTQIPRPCAVSFHFSLSLPLSNVISYILEQQAIYTKKQEKREPFKDPKWPLVLLPPLTFINPTQTAL
jgi:hypothetical protein